MHWYVFIAELNIISYYIGSLTSLNYLMVLNDYVSLYYYLKLPESDCF